MAYRRWTESELRYLAEAYPGGVATGEICRRLGRPAYQVYQYCHAIGLRRRPGRANRPSRIWTAAEVNYLVAAHRSGESIGASCRRLGMRREQIRSKRRRLGLAARCWTAAEIEVLREAYAAGQPIGRICGQLGRSPRQLRYKAGRLGLSRPSGPGIRRGWTAAEIDYLKAAYPG